MAALIATPNNCKSLDIPKGLKFFRGTTLYCLTELKGGGGERAGKNLLAKFKFSMSACDSTR